MKSLKSKFEKHLSESKKLTRWELPGATKYLKDRVKERDLKLISDGVQDSIRAQCPNWMDGITFGLTDISVLPFANQRYYPDEAWEGTLTATEPYGPRGLIYYQSMEFPMRLAPPSFTVGKWEI